jgi:hypothetical protein
MEFKETSRVEKIELTEKELAMLIKGEQQIHDGDFVWWRDIKRTDG